MTETEELEFYKEYITRVLHPEHFPFICNSTRETPPEYLYVCPQEGADVIHTYKLEERV